MKGRGEDLVDVAEKSGPQYQVDDSGRWSGGGTAFLNNVKHAEALQHTLRGGENATPIIPRNVPVRASRPQHPFVLAPQNAWPWAPTFADAAELQRVIALRLASAYYLRRADAVLRISGAIPVLNRRTSPVIHNVLDTGFETDRAAADGNAVEGAEGSFVSFGAMNSYRNVANLLLGYQRYRAGGGRRSLLIAGAPGSHRLQRELETLARSMPGVLLRSDALSRSECLAAMCAAAAVVLPSRVEASPVTALEAVACSPNVAASRIPGHQEILGQYGPVPQQSLFDPQSPDDIAEKMRDADQGWFRESHRKLADAGIRERARVDWGRRVARWLADLGDLRSDVRDGRRRQGVRSQ